MTCQYQLYSQHLISQHTCEQKHRKEITMYRLQASAEDYLTSQRFVLQLLPTFFLTQTHKRTQGLIIRQQTGLCFRLSHAHPVSHGSADAHEHSV